MARKGLKDRPLEKIASVEFNTTSRNGKKGRRKTHRKGQSNRQGQFQRTKSGKEKGMVELSIPRGRAHGINPGEIVGGIASMANIPGAGIGKIAIKEKTTFIDVQEEYVAAVLRKSGSYHFRDNHKIAIKPTAK
jgi:hypothetical protein